MENENSLVIVTGKGGVGKSTLSAALAYAYSRQGLRTLLVEIGDESFFGPFFNLDVAYDPVQISDNLDVSLWDWKLCLKEYVEHFLPVKALSKIFFENKVMKNIINLAPGLSEIAILGKLTSGIRGIGPVLEYDRIVLDSYATGHCLALLQAPKVLGEATGFGPLGRHAKEIHNILVNQKFCQLYLVSMVAEMPVVESMEFFDRLQSDFKIDAQIILNQIVNTELSISELEKLRDTKLAGSNTHTEFVSFLLNQQSLQEQARSRLKLKQKKLLEAPLIFDNSSKLSLITKLSEVFGG